MCWRAVAVFPDWAVRHTLGMVVLQSPFTLGGRRGHKMLGWWISIERNDKDVSPSDSRTEGVLATWETGLNGLEWLKGLVQNGQAVCLGGNGYPLRYSATAAAIAAAVASGPPRHGGPFVIGEDHYAYGGWTRGVKIDHARLAQCRADEILMIEAWDLS
jgi:hypothetical protein